MDPSYAPTLGSVIKFCWHRPRLWARELLWRALYGVFALLLLALASGQIYHQADSFLFLALLHRITLAPGGQWMPSIENLSMLSLLASMLKPAILAAAKWLLPLLGLGWVLAFGRGRMAVLRAYDPTLQSRPWGLAGLQALRLMVLFICTALWWQGIQWAARSAIHYGFSGNGLVTDLIGYLVWVSLLTLAALLVWTLIGWLFSKIVSLVVLGRLGQMRARSARGSGFVQASLMQTGLGLGLLGLTLVRLAAALLAMLLSALPTLLGLLDPGWVLYGWWIAVSLLYLLVSAFWSVVRQGLWLDCQKSVLSVGLSAPQGA